MWRPPITFISLHYAYIIGLVLLAFLVLLAYGTVPPVDAFFFACSSNTESGLNPIDVKHLKTGEQLVLFFFPIASNIAFVNIGVVVVRLYWFERRLRKHTPWVLQKLRSGSRHAQSGADPEYGDVDTEKNGTSDHARSSSRGQDSALSGDANPSMQGDKNNFPQLENGSGKAPEQNRAPTITWATDLKQPTADRALRIPPPQQRDDGAPLQEVDESASGDGEDIDKISVANNSTSGGIRRRRGRRLSTAVSIERVASSVFVLGDTQEGARSRSREPSTSRVAGGLRRTTSSATEDRRSSLQSLSKEELGGIEYRSLWLLLKIILAYLFGLHLLGVIGLVPWIHRADAKYKNYLHSQGQGLTWWAFYSSQTMVSNLGFTLTPDSMIFFKDATWPMLVMTFLAFAGNTCYPIFLRLVIWTMSRIVPKRSSMQEPLRFLLDHPRRCYTLLFPGKATWILFGILFALNFIDVVLIIVLDLYNKEVTTGLPPGPRILAALFQAASSRHTGTATFNLANVNPAVQFSLVVMMYISVFPIAFAIRQSNTYEDQTLGKYAGDGNGEVDENQKGTSYFLTLARNQLSFDLWWVMLGVFLITIAESDRVADNADPAFSVFAILFEVVSGYGNVGLSLGYPTVLTSLSGKFSTFSKLVICAMMIRGRHRGLPYALDRAIMLPGDDLVRGSSEEIKIDLGSRNPGGGKLKRFNTM